MTEVVTQSIEGIWRLILFSKNILPWAAVGIFMWLMQRYRENHPIELGKEEYVIKSSPVYFGLMLVCFIFFSWCLYSAIADGQCDIFIGLVFGGFALVGLIGVMNVAL